MIIRQDNVVFKSGSKYKAFKQYDKNVLRKLK